MKKWFSLVLIAILVLVAAVVVFKDAIAKRILVQSVRAVTGISMKAKRVSLDPFKGALEVRGLRFFNPKGFPERVFADIPELFLNIDLGALFQRKVHIQEMRLNLERLILVRDASGRLNLSSLRPVQEKRESEKKPNKESEPGNFQLAYLRLTIGQVYYKDYRVSDPPSVREFDVGLKDQVYENITDPGDLVRRVVSQALARTTLHELGDLEGIQRRIEKALSQGEQTLSEKTKKVLEEAKEALKLFGGSEAQGPSEAGKTEP
jgi:hypothetical protein